MRMGSRSGAHEHAGRQLAVAVVVAVVVGVASRWFFDVPMIVLGVLAAGALVLSLAAPRASVAGIVLMTTVSAVVAQLPHMSFPSVITGLGLGLAASLCIAVPLLIAGMLRQRRAFQRRGWALANAEADRHASEVRAAVQRERMALAAEMHDGLGHSITLVAVRLGQLSLDRELSVPTRAEVAEVRRLAAEAADELGVAVRLLRGADVAGIERAKMSLKDVLANAQNAGVAMHADVPADLESRVNQETATALTRAVREALTNAAKHSPSQPVDIVVRLTGPDVVLTARNSTGAKSQDPLTTTGSGLVGIRHRAVVLGGSLNVRQRADEFVLTLRLPTHARPAAQPEQDDSHEVRSQEQEALVARDRAARMVFTVPAALASALAFVAVAYFVLSNVLSVLPSDQFATITAGDDLMSVAGALPPLEMLDPPRDLFPPMTAEECRYYEASISFFDRVDVFVVCFEDGKVSRTGTVHA